MKASLILENAEKELSSYDSTDDTMKHKKLVEKNMEKIVSMLEKRAAKHDDSKLKDPEKACYDKYIPELKKVKYGTKEYDSIKKKMEREGLKHHFEENSHHPEHFKNGVAGMDIVDLMEMFCDWYSASQRSDTSFKEGIKSNLEKYEIDGQLASILQNSVDLL